MADNFIDTTGDGKVSEAWRAGLASIATLIAAALLIAVVILVANSNRERDEALLRERHSYEVMFITRALGTAMARSEAALGRFVMSGDKATGSLYYEDWLRAGRLLNRLALVTGDDTRQAALVRDLRGLYAQRGRELAPAAVRSNFRQDLNAVSLYYEAGKSDTIGRIDATMASIQAYERTLLTQRSATAARSADRSNFLAAILSGVGVLLVVAGAALAWATVQAMALGRRARRDAIAEAERAGTLEQAVAERTHELRRANDRLLQEARTRAAAEAQLRQVQKMEAVGQLTGGIAHDFNNMLAVVIGGLDLARRRIDAGDPNIGNHIDHAMEGARRAAALTRRLLTFARAEPLSPESVDPGRLIAGMSDLLDRTLGERIQVETHVDADPWQVWCDPHQLESALLNLAVNARDAMDSEGRLIIRTSNVTLSDGEIGQARAGEYVCVGVTDAGSGMTPEVLEHVFEPFFTTKPVGKGTGLGLSQIFGFTRQSGGEVAIQSTPGEGTTVSLYLPRNLRDISAATAWSEPAVPVAVHRAADAGRTTILVVEDDRRVRAMTVGGLEELGYRTIACASGDEAIVMLARRDDISLIITDVVMPGMTGPELIASIGDRYPHIGVLFVTGYAGEAGDDDHFTHHDVLRKPFTVNALATAVAGALTQGGKAREEYAA